MPSGERICAPHLTLMYRLTYEHGIDLDLSRSGKQINNARVLALATKVLNSALVLIFGGCHAQD